MENEAITRRRQFIILVIVTVIIFIGLVWLISTRVPWGRLGFARPTYTVIAQVERNCTYPLTYWEAHPELYPPQMVIGEVVYRERELEALLSDNSQDLPQRMKAQLAVAFLNNQSGADQSELETTVFEAYDWLMQHPATSPIADDALASGTQLFNRLQAYNLGLAEVGPCEAISGAALTGTAASIIAVGGSPTPSQTPILTATGSPTPTPTRDIGLTITPTRTSTPTRQPTRFLSPTATRYSPPQATNTPVLPTPTTPAPTFTPVTPTDTPEPTLPPRDTPEPTHPPFVQ